MLEINEIAQFFKPFPQDKNKSYIDLHIHTQASDGFIKPDFLANFVKDKPHLISVTDHNAIKANVQLYKHPDVNIIPGIEVGCQDRFELLIYFSKIESLINFYNQSVKPYKNSHEIARTEKSYAFYLKEAQRYNSFISIPHISGMAHKNYLTTKDYIQPVINEVNAIETYNHSLTRKRNKTAQKTRKKHNKFATIGSDAHLQQGIKSFYKLQNNQFSRLAYYKNNLFNIWSGIALFGKHLYAWLPTN